MLEKAFVCAKCLEHRGRDTHRKIYLLLRGLGAVYGDGERAGREPTLVQRLWCRGPSNNKDNFI